MKVLGKRNGIVRDLVVLGTTVALSAGLAACGESGGDQAQGGATGEPGETTRQQGQAGTTGQQAAANIDWDAVGQAIGKEGEVMDGGVYRVEFPRSDLDVTSAGMRIEPSLSLGSYAAFVPMQNGEAMVMGDLVLTEDELNPVISSLQENGLRQTAVHKHLLEQDPPIWWQHFEGTGAPVELAGAINEALSLTDTPMEASSSQPKELGLDTDRLDEIIGHEGENTGSTYNFSIPRAEPVTVDGLEIPASAGIATVMNFQPTGGGKAAINGDFVMTADEVDPVIEALRENGIEVVSLHNHMLDEEPRLFYMHFWANDDAENLARGLRAALDETNSAPSG
jgi:hypothetical protein